MMHPARYNFAAPPRSRWERPSPPAQSDPLKEQQAEAMDLFNQFSQANTCQSIMTTFQRMCDVLDVKPSDHRNFYNELKSKLTNWKAQHLWAKFDKKAQCRDYRRQQACANTRVLIIGAGPSGLRTAIEVAFLGGKAVVIEKRDRFSRNNVLHLWPYVIHDLKSLGAKKFFGKFCAGAIDHISIRALQTILLKVALLLGVEVHTNVTFEGLIDPTSSDKAEKFGWRALLYPREHAVSEYEFDCLIGAGGERNTLEGFPRKEFRGKLAIAITVNFLNMGTTEETLVEEISGVAFIFNQKFFRDLYDKTGIDLENIVYYKDDTHYFVMTAKKQSLLDKGVLIQDHQETPMLLARENVDQRALMAYAREAATVCTNNKLPHLEFAHNHYGQPDIAMFDFTSIFAASYASRVIERNNQKLLLGLVGDSLLEPFWPTGSGCARGFLGAMDAAWMIKSWASGKMTPLEVMAERESIYQLLSQTTPENLNKSFSQYALDPNTRYPNINTHSVKPAQVRDQYEGGDLTYLNQIVELSEQRSRRYDSIREGHHLLRWFQRQLEAYKQTAQIVDLTTSWRSGLALCSLIHKYRPELIDIAVLDHTQVAKNNQTAFDVAQKEFGITPVMSGDEMASSEIPDRLAMMSYLSQFYEYFRKETLRPPKQNRSPLLDGDRSPPKKMADARSSPATRVAAMHRFSNRHTSKKDELEEQNTRRRPQQTSSATNRRVALEEDQEVRWKERLQRLTQEEERATSFATKKNQLEALLDPMSQPRLWQTRELGGVRMLKGIKVPHLAEKIGEQMRSVPREHDVRTELQEEAKDLCHASLLAGLEPGKYDQRNVPFENEMLHEAKKICPKNPMILAPSGQSDLCYFCKERVYLVEKHTAEGVVFHRDCLKCDFCGSSLRIGQHAVQKHEDGGVKFFCQQHQGYKRRPRRSRKRSWEADFAQLKAKSPMKLKPHIERSPFFTQDDSTPKRSHSSPHSTETSGPKLSPDADKSLLMNMTPERVGYQTESEMEETEWEQTQHNLSTSLWSMDENSDSESTDEDEWADAELSDGDNASLSFADLLAYRRQLSRKSGPRERKRANSPSDSDTETTMGDEGSDADQSGSNTECDSSDDRSKRVTKQSDDEAENSEKGLQNFDGIANEQQSRVAATLSPPAEDLKPSPTSQTIMKNKMAFFNMVSEPVRIDPWAFLGMEKQHNKTTNESTPMEVCCDDQRVPDESNDCLEEDDSVQLEEVFEEPDVSSEEKHAGAINDFAEELPQLPADLSNGVLYDQKEALESIIPRDVSASPLAIDFIGDLNDIEASLDKTPSPVGEKETMDRNDADSDYDNVSQMCDNSYNTLENENMAHEEDKNVADEALSDTRPTAPLATIETALLSSEIFGLDEFETILRQNRASSEDPCIDDLVNNQTIYGSASTLDDITDTVTTTDDYDRVVVGNSCKSGESAQPLLMSSDHEITDSLPSSSWTSTGEAGLRPDSPDNQDMRMNMWRRKAAFFDSPSEPVRIDPFFDAPPNEQLPPDNASVPAAHDEMEPSGDQAVTSPRDDAVDTRLVPPLYCELDASSRIDSLEGDVDVSEKDEKQREYAALKDSTVPLGMELNFSSRIDSLEGDVDVREKDEMQTECEALDESAVASSEKHSLNNPGMETDLVKEKSTQREIEVDVGCKDGDYPSADHMAEDSPVEVVGDNMEPLVKNYFLAAAIVDEINVAEETVEMSLDVKAEMCHEIRSSLQADCASGDDAIQAETALSNVVLLSPKAKRCDPNFIEISPCSDVDALESVLVEKLEVGELQFADEKDTSPEDQDFKPTTTSAMTLHAPLAEEDSLSEFSDISPTTHAHEETAHSVTTVEDSLETSMPFVSFDPICTNSNLTTDDKDDSYNHVTMFAYTPSEGFALHDELEEAATHVVEKDIFPRNLANSDNSLVESEEEGKNCFEQSHVDTENHPESSNDAVEHVEVLTFEQAEEEFVEREEIVEILACGNSLIALPVDVHEVQQKESGSVLMDPYLQRAGLNEELTQNGDDLEPRDRKRPPSFEVSSIESDLSDPPALSAVVTTEDDLSSDAVTSSSRVFVHISSQHDVSVERTCPADLAKPLQISIAAETQRLIDSSRASRLKSLDPSVNESEPVESSLLGSNQSVIPGENSVLELVGNTSTDSSPDDIMTSSVVKQPADQFSDDVHASESSFTISTPDDDVVSLTPDSPLLNASAKPYLDDCVSGNEVSNLPIKSTDAEEESLEKVKLSQNSSSILPTIATLSPRRSQSLRHQPATSGTSPAAVAGSSSTLPRLRTKPVATSPVTHRSVMNELNATLASVRLRNGFSRGGGGGLRSRNSAGSSRNQRNSFLGDSQRNSFLSDEPESGRSALDDERRTLASSGSESNSKAALEEAPSADDHTRNSSAELASSDAFEDSSLFATPDVSISSPLVLLAAESGSSNEAVLQPKSEVAPEVVASPKPEVTDAKRRFFSEAPKPVRIDPWQVFGGTPQHKRTVNLEDDSRTTASADDLLDEREARNMADARKEWRSVDSDVMHEPKQRPLSGLQLDLDAGWRNLGSATPTSPSAAVPGYNSASGEPDVFYAPMSTLTRKSSQSRTQRQLSAPDDETNPAPSNRVQRPLSLGHGSGSSGTNCEPPDVPSIGGAGRRGKLPLSHPFKRDKAKSSTKTSLRDQTSHSEAGEEKAKRRTLLGLLIPGRTGNKKVRPQHNKESTKQTPTGPPKKSKRLKARLSLDRRKKPATAGGDTLAPLIDNLREVDSRIAQGQAATCRRLREISEQCPPSSTAPTASVEDIDTEGSELGDSVSLRSFCSQNLSEEDLTRTSRRQARVVARRQREAELKRLHAAQEIQRQLEEIELRQRNVEERGVSVERALRGERVEELSRPESEIMSDWFNVVHEKNVLVRYEAELMVRGRELELEDRHARLEQRLRRVMSQPEHCRGDEEKVILDELLDVVEQRDKLVALLDEDRIRAREDEMDLRRLIALQGLELSPANYLSHLRRPSNL